MKREMAEAIAVQMAVTRELYVGVAAHPDGWYLPVPLEVLNAPKDWATNPTGWPNLSHLVSRVNPFDCQIETLILP